MSRRVNWTRGVPIGQLGFNLCSAQYSECADLVYFTLSLLCLLCHVMLAVLTFNSKLCDS